MSSGFWGLGIFGERDKHEDVANCGTTTKHGKNANTNERQKQDQRSTHDNATSHGHRSSRFSYTSRELDSRRRDMERGPRNHALENDHHRSSNKNSRMHYDEKEESIYNEKSHKEMYDKSGNKITKSGNKMHVSGHKERNYHSGSGHKREHGKALNEARNEAHKEAHRELHRRSHRTESHRKGSHRKESHRKESHRTESHRKGDHKSSLRKEESQENLQNKQNVPIIKKSENNEGEKNNSGLLWSCVKSVYSSVASVVKKNIFAFDAQASEDVRGKGISNNSRLINKKSKRDKHRGDVIKNYHQSLDVKCKNDFAAEKSKHSNEYNSISNCSQHSLKKSEKYDEKNKYKYKHNDGIVQNRKRKVKNSTYDFSENDIRNLFMSDSENIEFPYPDGKRSSRRNDTSASNMKTEKSRDNHHHIRSTDVVDRYPRNDMQKRHLLTEVSSKCDLKKHENIEKETDETDLTDNLEEEISPPCITSRRENSQEMLKFLYNVKRSSKKGFLLGSSEDECTNKREKKFLLNGNKEKEREKGKSRHHVQRKDRLSKHHVEENKYKKQFPGDDSDELESSDSESTNKSSKSSRTRTNDSDEKHLINYKMHVHGKGGQKEVDRGRRRNDGKELEEKTRVKLSKKHQEECEDAVKLYYENIFEGKDKKEKYLHRNRDSSTESFKNIFYNKKEKGKKERICYLDNEQAFVDGHTLSINKKDIFKNYKSRDYTHACVCDHFNKYNNFVEKNKQVEGYGLCEKSTLFTNTMNEIKREKNNFKNAMKLLDSYIDYNLNGECGKVNYLNTLISYNAKEKGKEKNNMKNGNITKNERSMKIIEDITPNSKDKYVILKYDEESLIEALEKLRIDKQKKLEKGEEEEEEVEEEEEEYKKKKTLKIEKSIFFKCIKKDHYEEAIFILNYKGDNKVLIDKFNVPLLYSQIKCLIDTRWLNDEVINFYLSMIQEYNEQNTKDEISFLPKIFTFSTFFFQSLSSNGGYNYNKVARWTKRKKVDIFSFDLILIPLHVGGNHWTLGAINIKEKNIKLYDSLNMPNKKFFEYIKQYIVDEMRDKKKMEINISLWEYNKEGKSEVRYENGFQEIHYVAHSVGNGIPCQENGYDCGVFACMFAKCLSFNREFDFNQKDIKEIRMKMAYEISQGERPHPAFIFSLYFTLRV
ncbi:Ulp1 protease family C-terminal catalytic domain containing protein [Plasmodium ovale wallikeri]|uniref:Ulp1 protease family C-terminal catalytic domain containing protein n=1 Tax=Plasmodium ovale wallikeri TaxID=864142 RepID=A0A1A8ZZK7_PLAOA|nr:Ulp1 protease family C-terminal catalytic domain containing protein [Plasmodium ovale wallikeri]